MTPPSPEQEAVTETGPLCGGCGAWQLTAEEITRGWHAASDHDPSCRGDWRCAETCPVQVQCGPVAADVTCAREGCDAQLKLAEVFHGDDRRQWCSKEHRAYDEGTANEADDKRAVLRNLAAQLTDVQITAEVWPGYGATDGMEQGVVVDFVRLDDRLHFVVVLDG